MGRDEIEVSDEAVGKATGRDWDGWKAWLDARGAADLSHGEIVALLGGEAGLESGWWQQMVTNGYEKLVGRRVTGETLATGFQAGARRTVAADPATVWAWATSSEGLRAWLGEGDVPPLEKGAGYTLEDGSTGEVRVVVPGDRLRLTWHPGGWPRPSTLQLRITAHDDPGKAVVAFHQEHIPGPDERETRKARLKDGLRAIAEGVES